MKHLRHYLRLAIARKYLAFLALALVFCIGLAAYQDLYPVEQTIFLWFYNLPDWLLLPMLFLTQFGSFTMLVLVVIAAWAYRKERAALAVVLAGVGSYFVSNFFKNLIERPRPFDMIVGVRNQDMFLAGGFGFPSGHSAVAAAMATVLWFHSKNRYKPILALWVIIVAASRMYLGVHTPLDVIGGVLIGSMIGILAQLFIQKRAHNKIAKKAKSAQTISEVTPMVVAPLEESTKARKKAPVKAKSNKKTTSKNKSKTPAKKTMAKKKPRKKRKITTKKVTKKTT